jgi:hypothetical protein
MARPQVETHVRSLTRLHKAGSTARVLDLLRTWEAAQVDNEPIEKPMFSHILLNKSFIIKHRLRRNEIDVFQDGRSTATKVLIPIDLSNLDAGGRYLFVGQPNYLDILSEAIGADMTKRQADVKVLQALDKLPSFDPFLLREWLTKYGSTPDSRYFELSLMNIAKMEAFVFNEISMLVSMSLSGQSHTEAINRLVKKMLSSNYDNDMEPLRQTLRLSEDEFREGMFCWKGFLYYKWAAKSVETEIAPVVLDMKVRQPVRGVDSEAQQMLEGARKRLGRGMVVLFNRLAEIISAYDTAYHSMTAAQNPLAFKRFLLSSPGLFIQLGELLGQLQHVVQFWRFRTRGAQGDIPIPFDEYVDMMRDFEDGLSLRLG